MSEKQIDLCCSRNAVLHLAQLSVGTLDGGAELVEVHGVGRRLDERPHLLLRHVDVILLELQRAQLLRQVGQLIFLGLGGLPQVALLADGGNDGVALPLQRLRGELYVFCRTGKLVGARCLCQLHSLFERHPLA